ncbi:MAG: hypothetical protein PHH06_02195 [Candidatus Gracilibacteria bacterium]|nr:hypothetical protein [Candidatus Gracilibacteria bacterium]
MNGLKGSDNDILTPPDLDESILILMSELRTEFPNMSQATLEKNGAFIRMLEDYNGDSIHGIDEFLSKRGYEVKGIKYNNTSGVTFSEEEKKNIESGKYYIGLKGFFDSKGGKINMYYYTILAKKKDKFGIEGIKDKVSSFVNGLFHNPQTN